MKLSVNILNWNCWNVMHETLDLLKEECKFWDYEIIVVDNGSVDGSIEELRKLDKEWDQLMLIENDFNVGISKGKNIGITESEGDYILLLDGDVFPVRNSIVMLVEYFDKNPECMALGMYPNRWSNEKNTEMIKYHEDYCHKLHDVRTHNAACLFYGLYRRSLFDLGLKLNEEGEFGKPGYGWEDHDFYNRLKEMGHEQYVAHINNERGKYFHAINSSIKNNDCLGNDAYIDTSRKRGEQYHRKWAN